MVQGNVMALADKAAGTEKRGGAALLQGWRVFQLIALVLSAVIVNSCATVPQDIAEWGAAGQDAQENKDQEAAMDQPEDDTPAAEEGSSEAAEDSDDGEDAGGSEDRAGADDVEDVKSAAETLAGILLGFDDNYYTDWEAAFPLFDRYGAKATFFVQGNLAFCLNALARGHDIGYHTKTHIDLRKVDRAVWNYEALDSARVLRDGGVPLASFAYPFGFSEPWMDEELLKTYAIIRGFGAASRFYTKEETASGLIVAKSIDNTIIQDDAAFCQIIEDLCREAKEAGNVIVPLTTHNISNKAQWGIKIHRLEFLLRTASDMGLRFYTYRDLAGID
jgi:peptidoglycan/xylan/chitin deacetylase (PgdA/CDA1 family)